MNDKALVERLQEYDESLCDGVEPAGGWPLVYNDLKAGAARIEELEAENEMLKDALEFYADGGVPGGGILARKTLAACEDKDND